MMKPAGASLFAVMTLCSACVDGSSGANCTADEGLVGLSTFAATTIAPGESLEVSSFEPVCNGQCPVTGHLWSVSPDGNASGTLRVTYGAHCGPSADNWSNDVIGTCELLFDGATPLASASLSASSSADCVALWAGINPDDPADSKPCSEGSTNNFAPYIVFFDNSNASVEITGPGPANNPVATCSYAP